MPKLPPAEPSWLSPVLPWLILAFAVVTFVLGFSRGPLHGTKVYGRRGWFVFTVGIFFALLTPGLVFVAILEQDLVRLRHRMFADCSSPLVLSRVLLSRRPHRTAPLFDALKHAQDVCAKVWIGVVGLLYLIDRAVHGGS